MYFTRLGLFHKLMHKFILQTSPCNQTRTLRKICHFHLLCPKRRFLIKNVRPWPKPTIAFERLFHPTTPNKALPPIIWVVLRSVFKFVAVVTGRGLRKWWAGLPKNKRKYIFNKVEENKTNFLVGAALFGGIVYIYYIIHLVEDPITKRKKFLLFTEKQIMQMAMIECEVIKDTYKNKIVISGFQFRHVLKITQQIIQANSDLLGTKKHWQVLIVDDKTTKNAFILPSGHIFIFTGMLEAVNNDDQLAAIIAHEMAHALLSHSAEIASKAHLLELLLLLPIVLIWTMLPDAIALSSHYFTEYISAILFSLPFSRDLETEADNVGLEMIARACFDPQQASLFWKKMESLAENEQIEILSTHPNHKTRYQNLDGLMDKALGIRIHYCKNTDMDPRSSRWAYAKLGLP